MKSTMLLIVSALTLFFCGCTQPTNKPSEEQTLSVLSWNVWHAGHAKEYGDKGCEGVQGILKDSKADVILMIETYGCSDQVADHLGYYHRLISSNLSIYSRYPIVKTLHFPDSIQDPFFFGGAELNVKGKRVRVFDTWIHWLPSSTDVPEDKTPEEIVAWEDAGTRDDEIKHIMEIIQPYLAETDSIPIIMGGDFNSHSHLDWTEATKDKYNHRGKVVNWTVSNVMADHNFIDSFRELHPNPEKNTEEFGPTWLWTKDNNHYGDRIDYIYYQGKTIKATKSEYHNQDLGKTITYKGKQYLYTSDHGFVYTEFKLK